MLAGLLAWQVIEVETPKSACYVTHVLMFDEDDITSGLAASSSQPAQLAVHLATQLAQLASQMNKPQGTSKTSSVTTWI